MSTPERPAEMDDSRRKVVIVVAVTAAIIIAALFYFLMRASSRAPAGPTLEGAIRAGSPEFAQYQPKIVLDSPEADEAHRVVGDIWMNLRSTVRNFTGRTLNGLEIKASVVDHQGKPVKERTVVVLPNERQAQLEPNKTMPVEVPLEGLTDKDDRANIKMEVTAFRFK
jgi:hypothetical protein